MAKLSKPAAAELVAAEVHYLVAKRRLEEATAQRKELRKKHRAHVPLDTPVDVAGYRFDRSEKSTGRRFSLTDYLKRHKLTAAMRPYVSEPKPYDVWDIHAIDPDVPSIEALIETKAAAAAPFSGKANL